jgi:hypothetical protein
MTDRRGILAGTLALAMLLIPAGSVAAEDGSCNGEPAPILFKGPKGFIVVCGALKQIDPSRRLFKDSALELVDADTDEVAAAIATVLGVPVEFFPADPGARTTVIPDGRRLYKVLGEISESGRLLVNGLDFGVVWSIRQALGDGGAGVELRGARANEVVAALSVVTGRPITISGDGRDSPVSWRSEGTTMAELLEGLRGVTGADIVVVPDSDETVAGESE